MKVIADARQRRQHDPMARRVVLVAVPDAQILDVTGPLEVFSTASRELRARRRRPAADPAYRSEVAAPQRGPLATSSGVAVVATHSLSQLRGSIDTLVVAGGRGVERALADRRLIARLRTGDEGQEGLSAFLEKRTPNWR